MKQQSGCVYRPRVLPMQKKHTPPQTMVHPKHWSQEISTAILHPVGLMVKSRFSRVRLLFGAHRLTKERCELRMCSLSKRVALAQTAKVRLGTSMRARVHPSCELVRRDCLCPQVQTHPFLPHERQGFVLIPVLLYNHFEKGEVSFRQALY